LIQDSLPLVDVCQESMPLGWDHGIMGCWAGILGLAWLLGLGYLDRSRQIAPDDPGSDPDIEIETQEQEQVQGQQHPTTTATATTATTAITTSQNNDKQRPSSKLVERTRDQADNQEQQGDGMEQRERIFSS
uniref:DUF4203 domain-containing protein n=1 Tax=Brugia timori TaxID=42155 RepID=A0A0R3RCF7_9BILA